MNYSTTDPYFPENLNDYAPWVAEHGLTAPYGKCQCGCGEDAKVARRSLSRNSIEAGKPQRFLIGHSGGRAAPVKVRFLQKVKVRTDTHCWEWSGAFNTKGYGQLRVDGKAVLAHRVSWEIYNGPIPDGMQVCHHCDNPPCCNPAHLFLGTQADNVQDMIQKGRRIYETGTAHNRKLSDADVMYVRQALKQSDEKVSAIAKRLGVTPNAIRAIAKGRTWGNLK